MIALGVVGLGVIARQQHLPAIAADPRFTLAATASPGDRIEGVPGFDDVAAMLEHGPRLDAVIVATPPGPRFAVAQAALAAGLHVLLEKPPAATLSAAAALVTHAEAAGLTLFAAWHSRFAAGVAPAAAWLAARHARSVHLEWKEDVRFWHPGQEWLLAAGGYGVFDPAINALSILTAILPGPVMLDAAEMTVPEGRQAPIAATLRLRAGETPVLAELDHLQTGPQTWRIAVDTDGGRLVLDAGGAMMTIDGAPIALDPQAEYPALYARFAELIGAGAREVDLRPQQLVADAMLVGERRIGAPFAFQEPPAARTAPA